MRFKNYLEVAAFLADKHDGKDVTLINIEGRVRPIFVLSNDKDDSLAKGYLLFIHDDESCELINDDHAHAACHFFILYLEQVADALSPIVHKDNGFDIFDLE